MVDAHGQDTKSSPEILVQQADEHRDCGRKLQAADCYACALEVWPNRADLWVQLGNMTKDAGDPERAKVAYRNALELEPRNADTYLQLGHALKLTGDIDGAIEAYARAVQVQPMFGPAIHELVALGVSWRTRRDTSLGFDLLATHLATIKDMRRALDRIEAMLPVSASLAAVSVREYGLFRELHPTPAPPQAAEGTLVAVGIFGDRLEDIEQTLVTLRRQSLRPHRVVVLTTRQSPCRSVVYDSVEFMPLYASIEDSCIQVLDGSSAMIVAPAGARFDPYAIAWFAHALAIPDVHIAYADAETDDAGGHLAPRFRTILEPELVAQDSPAVMALRAEAVTRLRKESCSRGPDIRSAIAEWLHLSLAAGGVAHIPRVLTYEPTIARSPAPQFLGHPPARQERISVVVPTRDNGEMLTACIEGLMAAARDPQRLDFIVLDNGSTDKHSIQVLDELRSAPKIHVERVDEPFNWSRLSNIGSRYAKGVHLVFCNDDIQMRSAGWDEQVACRLRYTDVGAIGARLLYEDGSVQHGGMVAGFGHGGIEHEGRGARLDAMLACRLSLSRSVVAVTGAFMATTRDNFERLGGFDELMLPIYYSDVDYCFRLRTVGKQIIFDPRIEAVHRESATLGKRFSHTTRQDAWECALTIMRTRWPDAMQNDPGVNPHYLRLGRPLTLLKEPNEADVLDYIARSIRPKPWSLEPR